MFHDNDDESMDDQKTICRRVFVDGRVQGVFFRSSTRDRAQALGVKGWVRNLPDGRVEFLAWGPVAQVRSLIQWARSGPSNAYVTNVEVQDVAPDPSITSFRIRY
jgi:acylphosphatase